MNIHTPYYVRPLDENDFLEYVRLREEALRTDSDSFSSSYDEYQKISTLNKEQFFQQYLQYPTQFVLGAFAEEDHRILGMVSLQVQQQFIKRSHKARLFGMYVALSARGQGIAVKLLDMLTTIAKEDARCEQILLTVSPPTSPAYQLYRKMGFVEYGREPQALKTYTGYVDEILMLKFL